MIVYVLYRNRYIKHHLICLLNNYVLLKWLYVIILQVRNTQTNTDLSLNGPVGQVYTMVVGNDLLFAGTQVICLCENRS